MRRVSLAVLLLLAACDKPAPAPPVEQPKAVNAPVGNHDRMIDPDSAETLEEDVIDLGKMALGWLNKGFVKDRAGLRRDAAELNRHAEEVAAAYDNHDYDAFKAAVVKVRASQKKVLAHAAPVMRKDN